MQENKEENKDHRIHEKGISNFCILGVWWTSHCCVSPSNPQHRRPVGCTGANFRHIRDQETEERGDHDESSRTWLDGLGAQLDLAARGVYILVNDFDTMSRLVQRLHDEMEHRKFVADICVRKGKNEMLKEVVKEFQMHETWFMEQLEELEKQIYLCFLDINRSRRLVVEQMVKC
ncbi:UNVERIFIED_CONTAM: hypothetical protein Slati_2321300 [Sesamum latifolium]|uniref:Uncharacterized protein n=1 Tax=Sesamum latifolium TaxID=2727402 RepID=A0AAW2WA02_9LAMI